MKAFTSLSVAAASVGLAAALPAWAPAPASAVYWLDNNPDGSAVISLKSGPNGTLSNPVRTSTHGTGFRIIGTKALPTLSDSLMSSDPIVVKGDILITLNSASNTLVAFKIDPVDPQKLTLIGNATDTLGDYPVSVDYSEELGIACVLNGGTPAGVACFHLDESTGFTPTDNTLRSIAPFVQTDPPTIVNMSASQIKFTPDNSAVFALTKGAPGSIHTFGISSSGEIATQQVNTNQTDFGKLFGGAFIDETHFFVVDPTFGAAVLEYDAATLKFTEVQHTAVPDQGVICWASYAGSTKTAYGADGGKGAIWVFDDQGKLTGEIPINAPGVSNLQGAFDMAVDYSGKYLYALVGTAPIGVVTVDLAENKVLEYNKVSNFGNSTGWTGLATYPNAGKASF